MQLAAPTRIKVTLPNKPNYGYNLTASYFRSVFVPTPPFRPHRFRKGKTVFFDPSYCLSCKKRTPRARRLMDLILQIQVSVFLWPWLDRLKLLMHFLAFPFSSLSETSSFFLSGVFLFPYRMLSAGLFGYLTSQPPWEGNSSGFKFY